MFPFFSCNGTGPAVNAGLEKSRTSEKGKKHPQPSQLCLTRGIASTDAHCMTFVNEDVSIIVQPSLHAFFISFCCLFGIVALPPLRTAGL
jgi:hypothetical protein